MCIGKVFSTVNGFVLFGNWFWTSVLFFIVYVIVMLHNAWLSSNEKFIYYQAYYSATFTTLRDITLPIPIHYNHEMIRKKIRKKIYCGEWLSSKRNECQPEGQTIKITIWILTVVLFISIFVSIFANESCVSKIQYY